MPARNFNSGKIAPLLQKWPITHQKAGLKMTASTKIDLNHNKIARMEGLDELARALFPGNKRHQRVFLAIFVEIKWASGQFLPVLEPIADKHNISHRTLETVRAKMRRLGLIDHVSRFNKRYGYREGWVFSRRFERSLTRLEDLFARHRKPRDPALEKKDRDCYRYL